MLQLKNKRTYQPNLDSIYCNQCNTIIDGNLPRHSIMSSNGSFIHLHIYCHEELIKTKALKAYQHNKNFPFKKSCIHCHGDTHLPQVDNSSLFNLGLNSLSKVIRIGSLDRTVKIHEFCLKQLAAGTDVSFDKLISKAKLRALNTKSDTTSNPHCSLCNHEVSIKRNTYFTTNNLHFHKSCLSGLVQNVFDLKTQSFFCLDRKDIQSLQTHCIFCKKGHSIDCISVNTSKRADHISEADVGFHRECLLDFSRTLNRIS